MSAEHTRNGPAGSPPRDAAQDRAIDLAANALRAGQLVAFPTETVYGLGADATRKDAVDRIFQAKGRPAVHPLIVHGADAGILDTHGTQIPATARALAAAFWPGPLTLIVNRGAGIADNVTGGLATVGLRVPDHPVALALLQAFGGVVAAPSANRFGAVSPTTAAHVRESLGDQVDVILDGGPCRVGVESTIVDLSGPAPRLLRPGGVPAEAIEDHLHTRLAIVDHLDADAAVRAPGTLPSHYAPNARVQLCLPDAALGELQALRAQGLRVGILTAFFPENAMEDLIRIPLSETPDQAAAQLYAALREVDRQGLDVVIACPPPEIGLARAVADRLKKAAGPRD